MTDGEIILYVICGNLFPRIPAQRKFQFVLICMRKSSRSDRFFRRPPPFRNTVFSNEYSAGPKVSLFPRERCVLVPDSRWRVDNWPIVARPPWTVAFAYDVSREGAGELGGQEARAEKGCIDKDLPILSRAGPRRPRGLIYEWDQTPEVADGADWPSPVPLWYPVRPIIGWFLLSRPVSLSLFSLALFLFVSLLLAFLSLSSFFSSHGSLSRYRTPSPPPPPPHLTSSISSFSLVRLSSLLKTL